MMPTLLVDALFALSLALLYGYVARLMARRPTSTPEAASALRSFVVWWAGLGATTLLGGLRSALAGLDVLNRGLHAALLYLTIPALVAALWGLVDYLVYVHTGDRRWRLPILVGHALMGVFIFMVTVWMHPLGVRAEPWSVPFDYEHALGGPLLALVLLLILAPTLAASLGYLALAFRTRDPTARFRIVTVSSAFLLWFGSAALASVAGWGEASWWPLASRAIALGATLLVLFAYQPPARLRAHLERRALETPPPRPADRRPRLAPLGPPSSA